MHFELIFENGTEEEHISIKTLFENSGCSTGYKISKEDLENIDSDIINTTSPFRRSWIANETGYYYFFIWLEIADPTTEIRVSFNLSQINTSIILRIIISTF